MSIAVSLTSSNMVRPRMIGYRTIRNVAPKNSNTITSPTKDSAGRCDHDNYLDQRLETVSAKEAETFEVF